MYISHRMFAKKNHNSYQYNCENQPKKVDTQMGGDGGNFGVKIYQGWKTLDQASELDLDES